jgi:hypothetical protein
LFMKRQEVDFRPRLIADLLDPILFDRVNRHGGIAEVRGRP